MASKDWPETSTPHNVGKDVEEEEKNLCKTDKQNHECSVKLMSMLMLECASRVLEEVETLPQGHLGWKLFLLLQEL